MGIKLIIFDFDNTLADLAEVHFISLNKALSKVDSKFLISHEEQVSTFEGLSTLHKLKILKEYKGFPENMIQAVFDDKQKMTAESINESITYNDDLHKDLVKLKSVGYRLIVASNAIRSTVVLGLTRLGIIDLFEKIYSNEDVEFTKPHPQIYLKAMYEMGVEPGNTLIVEDSKNGRESALRSGAFLCEVNNPRQTTYNHIQTAISNCKFPKRKWYSKNTVNVVIPMSGAGSRMRSVYSLPKPLIDIHGKPMIQRVIENLNIEAQYTFIVQKEHCINHNLEPFLNAIAPNCNIIKTDGLTEGAACSVLLAKELINNDKHLLIANSDQLISWDSSEFMYEMLHEKLDGGILTFEKENDPKWSYVSLDQKGFVNKVLEKQPISNIATIGIYYFASGNQFVRAAEEMISANDRTNNEFYLAPTYNYMIKNQAKIKNYNVDGMFGVGTPEDLEYFKSNYFNRFKDLIKAD